MRVAAVQFRGDSADPSERRAALARWVWGTGPGTDLVVCPELAITGYVFEERAQAEAVAEPPDGPTFQALSPVAKALGTWVVVGFVERDRDRLFNSALVIDAAGQRRFVYRKTLLFDVDLIWASVGDSGYEAFDTDGGTFSVGICMDLNDPRFVSWLARRRPQALAFPTNWVEEGEDVWTYWAWRLHRTETALVAANAWGDDRHLRFSGRSVVMEPRSIPDAPPRWRVLAAAKSRGDALITAELTHAPRAPWAEER